MGNEEKFGGIYSDNYRGVCWSRIESTVARLAQSKGT